MNRGSFNKGLKVARVIARLNIGGPAQQALWMTREFRSHGYPALLIAGAVAPGEKEIGPIAGRHIHAIRLTSMSRQVSLVRDLQAFWRLLVIFHRWKPTVVHTHTAKAGFLGRIAAKMLRVPVTVHTFHGNVFEGYFSPLISRLVIWTERCLGLLTDAIVVISESQRLEIQQKHRIAPGPKIHVIPLGPSLASFMSSSEPASPAPDRLDVKIPTTLLWVGRLVPIKDPLLMIAVAGNLRNEPDIQTVMVGDGELRPEVESRIRSEGVESRVRCLGWVEGLSALYSASSIVVLTSRNEGTPIVLLEAMASSRAFVATNVGGVRDLMCGPVQEEEGLQIYRNGILVPPDPALIAAAIRFLNRNPGVALQMGRQGREFVADRFSPQRLYAELEKLYHQLLCTKGIAT